MHQLLTAKLIDSSDRGSPSNLSYIRPKALTESKSESTVEEDLHPPSIRPLHQHHEDLKQQVGGRDVGNFLMNQAVISNDVIQH